MPSVLLKILTIITLMYFLSGCGTREETSAFENILSSPPYSALSDSIRREPRQDELYFRRAVLLNRNNYPEPALADFQKAWSLKKDERYALGAGTILLDKNADSALLFLKDALKEIPASFLLKLSLARAFEANNKNAEALKICDDILSVNPGQVDILKMKSGLLAKNGNIPESIAILEKAYYLAPFDLDLNYDLAFKYAESKNPKLLRLCDSLIKADSQQIHAEPYYYKGIYFSNINDKNRALAQFDEAIRQNYYFLNSYIEKGRILYEQQKYPQAYKVFNLAMTISPKFADAYFWMAKCQEALGEKEEARQNYQRAVGLDKTFIEAKEAAERLVN